jgi:signal transduction histidine kinase
VFFRDLWRTIAQGKVWQGEIRNRAKDGSIYWVATTIVPFLNDKGKPYQYVSIRHETTQRKKMEEQVQALPKRIIQAQEQECDRIARDLHDDLGQSLVHCVINYR